MDTAFSVLPKILRKRGLQEHANASLLVFRVTDWLEQRFPGMSGVFKVQGLHDGVLTIECSHSIALQECNASLSDLRQYLSAECAFAVISTIKVVRMS